MIYQKDLACKLLEVHAIDIDIDRIIHLKSKGNPGWMKKLLKSLVNDELINVTEMEAGKAVKQGYTLSGLELKVPTVHLESMFEMDETSSQALSFCTQNIFQLKDDTVLNDGKMIKVAGLVANCDVDSLNLEEIEDGN